MMEAIEEKQKIIEERIEDLHQQIHDCINNYDSKLRRCRNEVQILNEQMEQLKNAKSSCVNLLRMLCERETMYMELRGLCNYVDGVFGQLNMQQPDHATRAIKGSAGNCDIGTDKEESHNGI